MKKNLHLCRVVIPLLAFGAVWFSLLAFHEPTAKWCKLSVEEPMRIGSDARLAVRLTGIRDAGVLSVDLHWYGKMRENRGYLAGSDRVPVSRGESMHEISIPIRDAADLGYVSVVIYLSPNGSWSDRTCAASSEALRVGRKEGSLERKGFHARRCYTLSQERRELTLKRKNEGASLSALPYHFAGLLCLACGVLSFAAPRRHPWLWLFLGVLTAAQGFLKQAHLASELTGLLRHLFVVRGLYFHHRAMQKLVLGGLAAAGAVAALNAKRIIPKHLSLPLRLALYGVIAMSCLSFLHTLSYHYTDVLLERRLLELPLPGRLFPGHASGNLVIYRVVELLLSGFVAFSTILHLTSRKQNILHS
jgi:hypothetical protein